MGFMFAAIYIVGSFALFGPWALVTIPLIAWLIKDLSKG